MQQELISLDCFLPPLFFWLLYKHFQCFLNGINIFGASDRQQGGNFQGSPFWSLTLQAVIWLRRTGLPLAELLGSVSNISPHCGLQSAGDTILPNGVATLSQAVSSEQAEKSSNTDVKIRAQMSYTPLSRDVRGPNLQRMHFKQLEADVTHALQ